MSHTERSIALIGARGAGKSRLSRKLGKRMGRVVFSTDTQVCFQCGGKTVQQIVSEVGWTGFRDLEYEILSRLCPMRSSIIDCGGGILVEAPTEAEPAETFSARKARLLKEHCVVVYLNRPMSWLLSRVEPSAARPTLSADPYEELLQRRMPWYEQIADVTLDAGNKGTKDLIPELLEHPSIAGLLV